MVHTFAQLGMVPYKRVIRFNKSRAITPLGPGITITMVRAEHSSDVVNKVLKTKKSAVHPGGQPSRYIIRLEDGYTIYHAGDTGVLGDMKFIGEYYKPELALLPIGGHFTTDPAHAVKNLLKVKHVVPIHYGTFRPLKGRPAHLVKALGGYPAKMSALNPGDKMKIGK